MPKNFMLNVGGYLDFDKLEYLKAADQSKPCHDK